MVAASSEKPPLAILLLGASGLIGGEIARVLVENGHRVVGVGRNVAVASRRLPDLDWRSLDIAEMTQSEHWIELLGNFDLVINASGALQDSPTDRTRALQVDAMNALFSACQHMQLRLIHISAAGVEHAKAPFMRQKHEADAILQGMNFDWVILRPGLVLSAVA